MKKTLALLLALLMLAACLAGCAAKQETPAAAETTAAETSNQPVSEETYYYICPLANLEYWLAHKAGLEDACRELNVTPKFVGECREGSAASPRRCWRSMSSKPAS